MTTTTDSEFRLLLDQIIMDKYEQLTSNTTTTSTNSNTTISTNTTTSPPTVVVSDETTEVQEESTDSEELRKAKEWLYKQGVTDAQEYMEQELIKKHKNFLNKSKYDNQVQKENKKKVLKLGK
jgi:hypothetical protein